MADLWTGDSDGFLEECPCDDLNAGWCGQASMVAIILLCVCRHQCL